VHTDEKLRAQVVSVRVYKTPYDGPFVNFDELHFQVYVYEPQDPSRTTSLGDLLCVGSSHKNTDLPYVRVVPLPAVAYDDTWDNLVFEPRVHDRVFEALLRLGEYNEWCGAQAMTHLNGAVRQDIVLT
jgi:hypothetical protein